MRALSAVPARGVGHSRRALRAVAGDKLSVLVTGAGGRTGSLVLEKLLSEPDTFTAKGLVRSPWLYLNLPAFQRSVDTMSIEAKSSQGAATHDTERES